MACRLVGAKPLSETMLECCQLDSYEQTSVKFKSKFWHFISRKCLWKWRPFCLSLNVLITVTQASTWNVETPFTSIIDPSRVGNYHASILTEGSFVTLSASPKFPIECFDSHTSIPYLAIILTHWGRVTQLCVHKLSIIGSDDGFLPDRRQAIIWTNAGILLIGPLGTNFSEIVIETDPFE